MNEFSTKPYFIRAIYDWCSDSALTPYLAVKVNEQTRVPKAYVKDGEIVINLSMDAVRNLNIGNEEITCGGRFGGVSHGLVVPIAAVIGIFAKETGQGLVFQGNDSIPTLPTDSGSAPSPGKPTLPSKPRLRVVK
ncbi:ClpXP protease specificity-enhancing factor [Candidatus Nitrotoga sp. 1052]|uniref:ClpXP protease specificity-enhancing factor n=1 Tax=Candidatus Nitrotoga sp. 1052 TaxID=2886964 RepID=UPI001EF40E8E|nr:ClpXP protease specificity-enhancing factor [Candidatus Nitrotoga sp. 1052]CAH1087859.1 ClpXP protease specificity-enhancing factor / Stringent starvation protein B [Candidatus Nitrotoga sp. 1052]